MFSDSGMGENVRTHDALKVTDRGGLYFQFPWAGLHHFDAGVKILNIAMPVGVSFILMRKEAVAEGASCIVKGLFAKVGQALLL